MRWLGEGKARVILPITDPYVVHHGALGSFALGVPAGRCRARTRWRERIAGAARHREWC